MREKFNKQGNKPMININDIVKTVYGNGQVVKINKASVIVFVSGERRKFTHKQIEILNG